MRSLLTRVKCSFLKYSTPADTKTRADVYFSVIAKAVSQLPANLPSARESVYERARSVLAERSLPADFEQESFALEAAIHRVEKGAPKITIGSPLHRPPTM